MSIVAMVAARAAAAPSHVPVVPTHALEGPVASLEAWCQANDTTASHCYLTDIYEPWIYLPADVPDPAEGPAPSSPWREARVFVVAGASYTGATCMLGVETARGWFVGPLAECYSEFRHGVSVQLRAIDVIPGAPGNELELRIHGSDHAKWRDRYKDENGDFHTASNFHRFDYEELVVCGVGPSRTPHCTKTLYLAPDLTDPSETFDISLAARWSRGDLILERGDGWGSTGHGALAPSLRAIQGRHRIVFP